MRSLDRLLRAAPFAPFGGQILLATGFALWLGALGALPIWAPVGLLVAWAVRERRRDAAIHAVVDTMAADGAAEYPAAQRRLRRLTAVLAHRAGVEPPRIVPQAHRSDHNFSIVKAEDGWAVIVTSPALLAIDAHGLIGRPLAGVVAHEIAHRVQDRRWHHLNRPLRASVLSAGLVALLAAPWTGQWIVAPAVWLVASLIGALDRLITQSLELRADALAVRITGDAQDLRLGMAVLSVLDVLAFEPLPRHLAQRMAGELRAFGADLGGQMKVAGEPLEVLAARIEREASPRRRLAAALGILVGEWPASHPGPARRLALLAATPTV